MLRPPGSRKAKGDQRPTSNFQLPSPTNPEQLGSWKLESWELTGHEGASAACDRASRIGAGRGAGAEVILDSAKESASDSALSVRSAGRASGGSPQGRAVGRRDRAVREGGEAEAVVRRGLLVSGHGVLHPTEIYGMPRPVPGR